MITVHPRATPLPPPGDWGRYAGPNLVVRRDWNTLDPTTWRAQVGMGVFADSHLVAPKQSESAYSDLVPDPHGIFGMVCRYNHDSTLIPGSTLPNGTPYGSLTNRTTVDSITGLPIGEGRVARCDISILGLPSAERRHIWVRHFMLFDPEWWPEGPYPDKHANSYKGFFLNWENAGFRGHFPGWFASGRMGIEYGQAFWGVNVQATIKGYGTPYEFGVGVPGWSTAPGGKLAGMNRTSITALGTFEWWEFLIGHEELVRGGGGIAARSYATFAVRQFTVGGKINPLPWVWKGHDETWQDTTKTMSAVSGVSLGRNRNKHLFKDAGRVYLYRGPVEIVKGERNPFYAPTWPGTAA